MPRILIYIDVNKIKEKKIKYNTHNEINDCKEDKIVNNDSTKT